MILRSRLLCVVALLIGLNALHCTVFNIRDFGAVGDGSTDDTPAVLAAIAECSINSGVLYIPSGTFVIRSSLIFKTDRPFTIAGDGMSSVILWEFNDHLLVIAPGRCAADSSWKKVRCRCFQEVEVKCPG